MKNIYDILIQNCTNERLDEIAFQDKLYCSIRKRYDEKLQKLDSLSLSKEESKTIDDVINVYTELNARYTELAYKRGLEDAAALLSEMGLIKHRSVQ